MGKDSLTSLERTNPGTSRVVPVAADFNHVANAGTGHVSKRYIKLSNYYHFRNTDYYLLRTPGRPLRSTPFPKQNNKGADCNHTPFPEGS
ncbi:hypothetical protein [Aromatoleum toluclasticum]|uniref:hypothetical protein n=1 Tax=Aromatoleum toluclasticum TaxID=92003 RepID=UPI0012F990F4|nr:hypothetical protein [Aromatoleum toluclasticum]